MDDAEEDEVVGSVVSFEEESKPLRVRGFLWRPGKDKQVPGEILFDHGEEGASVHLFGCSGATEDFDGYLRGWVHPMRHVSLLKCLCHNRQSPRGYGLGTESATLGFIDMWIGDLGFDCADEIAFESISFGITNLSVWLGCGYFPPKDNKSKSVAFNRLIFEDNLVRVYLAFVPVESVMDRGNGCHIQRREACVYVKSKNGLLPYYGETKSFEYYEDRLTTLLGMLIGQKAVRYGRCGRADYPLDETLKTSGVVWRLNRRPLPRKLQTPLTRDGLFVPYEDIEEVLPCIVETFFKLNDEISRICGRLIYFRSGQDSIPYGSVPELVFMFEGLARNLYDEELKSLSVQSPGFEIHKANVAKLAEWLKDEPVLMQWLSKRLKFNPPKLQKLFDLTRVKMREAFFHLDNDNAWVEYTNYLRARRDGFAHSESKALMHDKMYLPAYFWLECLMMGMVLTKCGVSPETVRRGVARCADFRWGVETYYGEFIKSRM